MASEAVAIADESHGPLRRELLGPTAATALNGVAPAGLVGRAVVLASHGREQPIVPELLEVVV